MKDFGEFDGASLAVNGAMHRGYSSIFAKILTELRLITLLISAVMGVAPSALPQTLWTSCITVKEDINLNGNAFYTDSYDSQDPDKSTNRQYDPSKFSGDSGDLTIGGTIMLSNANVYGHAHLSTNGTISFGFNSGLGPHSGQGSPTSGWVVNDANFILPDTTPPAVASSWSASCSGDVRSSSNYVTLVITNSFTYTTPAQGGVITNITFWNTNSVNPGAGTVGLVTNVGTATTNHYPGPMPGLTTNTISVISNSVPDAGTYLGNVTTLPYDNQTTLPSPLPLSITTNYQTSFVTNGGYPSPGTYLGAITTNWNGGHTQISSYSYNRITGYTYNYNLYLFNRITGYFSYNVPIYSWPNYNYVWSLYTTNTFYITNSYAHLFFANQNYKEASLTGSACVLGVNVTVYLPNGLTGADHINYQTPGTVSVRSCGSTNWAVVSIPQIPTMLVYAGSTSVGIAANNVVNPNGFPGSFIVYCAPTVTSFSLAGHGAFSGILVAPNADLTLNGGGSANEDFCGSIMAKSATLNGRFSFHYDESVRQRSFSPPTITTQPVSETVIEGHVASFIVRATGFMPISYQWRFQGSNIPNATNGTLTITNAAGNNAGSYSVLVTNEFGGVTSSNAILIVLRPPVISKQPRSVVVLPGGSAAFTVAARGLTPFSYQWQTNGVPISCQTNATLAILNAQPSDCCDYTVNVSNADGTDLSQVAKLQIANSPTISAPNLNLDTFTFSFSTEQGLTYVVEYNLSLDDPAWRELTRIAGTGSTVTITDDGLTNAIKFYRIQLQ
jgi:hypothetical protein